MEKELTQIYLPDIRSEKEYTLVNLEKRVEKLRPLSVPSNIRIQFNRKNYKNTYKLLSELNFDLCYDDRSIFIIANTLLKVKKYEELVNFCNQVQTYNDQKNTHFDTIYLHLAKAYYDMKDISRARKYLLKHLKIDPKIRLDLEEIYFMKSVDTENSYIYELAFKYFAIQTIFVRVASRTNHNCTIKKVLITLHDFAPYDIWDGFCKILGIKTVPFRRYYYNIKTHISIEELVSMSKQEIDILFSLCLSKERLINIIRETFKVLVNESFIKYPHNVESIRKKGLTAVGSLGDLNPYKVNLWSKSKIKKGAKWQKNLFKTLYQS